MIIIPIKWPFHWEYTLFPDIPKCYMILSESYPITLGTFGIQTVCFARVGHPNWWGCKQIQKQSKTCINSRTSMRIEDARKMMMQRTWGREPLRTSLGYFLEGFWTNVVQDLLYLVHHSYRPKVLAIRHKNQGVCSGWDFICCDS